MDNPLKKDPDADASAERIRELNENIIGRSRKPGLMSAAPAVGPVRLADALGWGSSVLGAPMNLMPRRFLRAMKWTTTARRSLGRSRSAYASTSRR